MTTLEQLTELEAKNDLLRMQIEQLSYSNYDKVRDWHEKFDQNALPRKPTQPNSKTKDRRITLMIEELLELADELGYKILSNCPYEKPETKGKPIDFAKTAKEISDLLYVVYGTAVELGIDIDSVFDRVHKSNMSKVDANGNVVRREDGKILKGENYKPPYLDDLF